ncbi:ATP-binding protein [Anaerobacillus alkaliphilus]|uniref:ATP-binding protein n=1 Tax=Anaerobacillus alkaliphilus TaxID=1548597 RepID=A0A4Q0VSL0_9BACI|nr:ATP-binding protein [Anaerobacillus alkaliphilus]RXJ00650.1 ATP-binding protein [Anaerobacillus alkaliphilus]
MHKNEFIFHFQNIDRQTTPNYYDYAIVIEGIKAKLKNEIGIDFHMYADEETSNEIWDVLEEDLQENKEEVQLISYIYDGIETYTISSNHTNEKLEFIVKPRLNNAVYYYPRLKVALARATVFQMHNDMNHDFVLASDHESILEFLAYVLKRKKDYHKNYVTVFTDTEDGVDNKKERITTLVDRDQVFLEENLKKEIYRSIDQFFTEDGKFFRQYNIPYKRGILLYGSPGNGKTTLVKSIANSIQAPVVYWQITEHTSSYTVKEVFTSIAKMTPMVLVIEDMDSMPEEVRSVFLNILDGSTSKEGIFLIGTTNYPEKIDPALINRSGRFDRAYELKLPTDELRYKYLLMKQFDQFMSLEDVERIVQNTKGFSFAQLNELYTSVALQWHYEHEVNVDMICENLQADNKKSQTANWATTEQAKMGFGF